MLERTPQQHGDDQREHDHFLERAGPERRERLDQADQQRAGGGNRVARQAADDRADEALQADEEAGVVVDGGDFSSVVNTGFYFSASSSSTTTLNLSGTHVGSMALAINGDADSMSNINYRSIREVLSENTPSEGFVGDRWVKPTPEFGGGWVYVCTSGSYLGSATWRMVSQFGVKKDTTANRPSVSSIESGLMYLDTKISANGKAIWYTGTSWVNESGTVV